MSATLLRDIDGGKSHKLLNTPKRDTIILYIRQLTIRPTLSYLMRQMLSSVHTHMVTLKLFSSLKPNYKIWSYLVKIYVSVL